MSNQPEAQAILEPAATRVRDPLSGRSVWLAGLVREAMLSDDKLEFTLAVSSAHTPADRERMKEALERNIEGLGWRGKVVCHTTVTRAAAASPPAAEPGHGHSHGHSHGNGAAPKKDPVKGMSGPGMQAHGGPITKQPIPGVKHIVAVASGKGGVGKSTVATNLAVGLTRRGLKVGLMDADIYGPSLPMMMNVSGKPYANDQRKIIPLQGHGVACMSIGLLVDETEPVIWRGPMVMGVVKQFLQDVAWGELDVLVIDLPPGTGDAQLTMIQAVPISGAVIVTTPQDVAVLDAVRGVEMFKKLDVAVLGVVENMSWLELPDGTRMHPFGQGGGQRTAERYSVPLLAQLPLDSQIREGGDAGVPAALADSGAGKAFMDVADAVAEQLQQLPRLG